VRKPKRPAALIVMMVLGTVALHLGIAPALLSRACAGEEGRPPALPEGIRGFKGMLVGTIVIKGKRGFVLKVEKVTKVWRQNEAKNPESIIGKEIEVSLWRESRLVERHAQTLAGLKKGDRVVVEAFHFQGDHLSIVEELRKAERAATEEAKEPPKEGERPLREGIGGFKGILVGTLVEKGDTFFVLKVAKVGKVWKGSRAKDPASAVGKNMKFTLRREGRLAERLVGKLADLKPGDRVEVGALHIVKDILAAVEWLKKVE